MIRRFIAVIFALGALCTLSDGAQAQSGCYIGVTACAYQGAGTVGNRVLVPMPPANSQCAPSSPTCENCWLRSNSKDYGCAPTGVLNDCPG
jgi:hypothetical protein